MWYRLFPICVVIEDKLSGVNLSDDKEEYEELIISFYKDEGDPIEKLWIYTKELEKLLQLSNIV